MLFGRLRRQARTGDGDFASISPSAASVLAMKAVGEIPFAREAASLLFGAGYAGAPLNDPDNAYVLRSAHFEARYRSIDTLLPAPGVYNYLEISSGFSFRGLELCRSHKVTYMDTDLPDVVATKRELVGVLAPNTSAFAGTYDVCPLNVLDDVAFRAVAARFPAGPLAVINEGLLVYFDADEKRRLCTLIRSVLSERGGVWITGDIYVKTVDGEKVEPVSRYGRSAGFLARHNVWENRFASYDAAREFFAEYGLNVTAIATVDPDQLRTVATLRERGVGPPSAISKRHRSRQTWMLEPAGD